MTIVVIDLVMCWLSPWLVIPAFRVRFIFLEPPHWPSDMLEPVHICVSLSWITMERFFCTLFTLALSIFESWWWVRYSTLLSHAGSQSLIGRLHANASISECQFSSPGENLWHCLAEITVASAKVSLWSFQIICITSGICHFGGWWHYRIFIPNIFSVSHT